MKRLHFDSQLDFFKYTHDNLIKLLKAQRVLNSFRDCTSDDSRKNINLH
jgi:hypothetical protein